MNILRKIIREAVNKEFSKTNEVLNNSIRMTEMFSTPLTEDLSEETKKVVEKINNDDWEKPNAQRFYDALNKTKHKKMLTDYTVSDFSKMKLFKLNGYNIGFALKEKDGKYSEIVSVFNNEPVVIGKDLVKAAVRNGGCELDYFDFGFLTNLYKSLGFIEYKRDSFDPQYDPDSSFRNKYGESDIIYSVHKSCLV